VIFWAVCGESFDSASVRVFSRSFGAAGPPPPSPVAALPAVSSGVLGQARLKASASRAMRRFMVGLPTVILLLRRGAWASNLGAAPSG
jgi:hypothetical protein